VKNVVTNSRQLNSALDSYVKRFERRFRVRVRMLVNEGMRRLLRRTPVNTGQAAMNYVASVGHPVLSNNSGFTPVEATNKLPLGSERLRPAAEQESKATLAQVDFSDPFRVFWITNATPHISGLESGELPSSPYRPRSPQGMFGVTLQELITILETTKL